MRENWHRVLIHSKAIAKLAQMLLLSQVSAVWRNTHYLKVDMRQLEGT